MQNDYSKCSVTLDDGTVLVNTTPHSLNFKVGEEKVVIPTSVPQGEKTGFAVINARSSEEDLGGGLVKTNFQADQSGKEIINDIYSQYEPSKVRIIGSMIATNAYSEVVGMVPAPGYERVPPAEKLMDSKKFNVGNEKPKFQSYDLNVTNKASEEMTKEQAKAMFGNGNAPARGPEQKM